jgi:hypothetical protein
MFKKFIMMVVLGLTFFSSIPVASANYTTLNCNTNITLDCNTRVMLGRISLVSYDLVVGQYVAFAKPFDEDKTYIFYLDIQGDYNELVDEALNRLLDNSLVQLTIDDNGNPEIEDDFVIGAIF